MRSHKKINKCRSCKEKKLKKLFTLGNQYFTGIFPKNIKQKVPVGKLDLNLCQNCSLVQLGHNFNLKYMYGDNYGYKSSLNTTMVNHLKQKAKYLRKYLKKKNNQIVDIGSNDGTFLSFFLDQKKVIGIDPTIKKFSRSYNRKIEKIIDFFPPKKNKISQKVDLFTSIACFYDLLDPIKFAKEIYNKLADEGVWHFEQSYLPFMLKNFSYDTICHEHLEYYSLKSTKYILDKVGLKIIDITFNDINGGSIAITVSKNSSKYKRSSKISKILKNEKKLKIHRMETYLKFFKRIDEQSKKLKKFITEEKKRGKTFSCVGASTKGNVILQYCKLNYKKIDYIYEVNKDKYGSFSPGTKIKIREEKKIELDNPDYLIILPWHFRKFFIENKNKIFPNRKIIFPLPKFEIVD